MITLNFPFKLISKDNSKIFNRAGRFFLTKENKEFEAKIKSFAVLQYQGKPLEGPLSVNITASFKNKVHCDCLNLPKSVMDALQGVVFENDKQIMRAAIEVFEDGVEGFRVVIGKISKRGRKQHLKA